MITNNDVFFRNPCSCEGNNENCFKCGGWGYLDNIGNQKSLIKKKDDTIGVCKVSKSIFGISTQERNKKIKAPKAKNSCPRCGILIGSLHKHIEKFHANETVEESRLKALQKTLTEIQSRALIKCPKCSSMIRANRLQKHLEKAHSQRLERNPRTSSQSSSKDQQPSNTKSALESNLQTKKLDGTRDYYAAYRERGQFGSHPSHDDYSEESES